MSREKVENYIPEEFITRNPQFAAYKANIATANAAFEAWTSENAKKHKAAVANAQAVEAEKIEIDTRLKKAELQDRLRTEIADNFVLKGRIEALDEKLTQMRSAGSSEALLQKKYAQVILSGEVSGREKLATNLLSKNIDASEAIDILKAQPRASTNSELKSLQVQAIANLATTAPSVDADMTSGEANNTGADASAVAQAKQLGEAMKQGKSSLKTGALL